MTSKLLSVLAENRQDEIPDLDTIFAYVFLGALALLIFGIIYYFIYEMIKKKRLNQRIEEEWERLDEVENKITEEDIFNRKEGQKNDY